jgi:hypothetical protein
MTRLLLAEDPAPAGPAAAEPAGPAATPPTYATPEEVFVTLKNATVLDKLVSTNYHDYGGRSCAAGSRVVVMLYANGPAWEQYQVQVVHPWSAALPKPAGAPLCYDTCATASNGGAAQVESC